MNSITDKESNYLTSKEAIESTEPHGCSTKEEMCEGFAISRETLDGLLSGKIKKVKLTKESVHYEEDDLITDLREALDNFIDAEISLGADPRSIKLAIKNIAREQVADKFPRAPLLQ